MATEADVAKAQALKVRAITVDRAKDVLKVRAREKALVQKWAREYVMVSARFPMPTPCSPLRISITTCFES